jgi:hypothetical protein
VGSPLGRPVDFEGCLEEQPCVSPDGCALYFCTWECRGGAGGGEFWVARKSDPCGPDTPFSQVFRIDDRDINTEKNEKSICVSRDGTELVFTRKKWQLWTAQFNVPHDPAAGFANERLLQGGISLDGVFSYSPSLSPCGHYLLWSDWPLDWDGAGPPRQGGHDASTTDIWMARRDHRDDGTWGDFSVPVNLPEPVNTAHHEISPWISYDGLTLLLVSNRRQPGNMQYAELVELPITGDLCGLVIDPDAFPTPPCTSAPRFRRGDCNDDGIVDISDAVCILNWLFLGGAEPGCLATTNTNEDTGADLSDAVYLLGHLFGGGPAPVDPFPECGLGTAEDYEELGCDTPQVNCPSQ